MDQTSVIKELMNRPRYDLNGERYGNTLSDDMFSMKNPSYNGHAPEGILYLDQPYTESAPDLQPGPVGGWDMHLNPNGNFHLPSLQKQELISRKKNVTDGIGQVSVNKQDDWGLLDDILEFPDFYTQEQVAWAEAIRDRQETAERQYTASTEGQRAEQFGNAPDSQSPRRGAEWDPYLGTYVDYYAMPPETMEQLAKMGVNRPQTEDDLTMMLDENGNATYNSLLNAYRLALEKGWR